MNCETAKDLLGAYHEGLLDPRARAGLERHFASCEGCRQAESEMRSVHKGLVALFEAHRLPGDFDRRVIESVESRRQVTTSRRRPGLAWASIAAAAVVGVVLILAGTWVGETPQPAQNPELARQEGAPSQAAPPDELPVDAAQSAPDTVASERVRVRPGTSVDVAKYRPVGGEPQEDRLAQERLPGNEQSPESMGHGRPSAIDSDLLASPPGDGGDGTVPGDPDKRRPRKTRPEGVGPRRPSGPGRDRLSDERRRRRENPPREGDEDTKRRREELAEKARQRREAGDTQEPGEVGKLEPQERRKIASAVKESAGRGVPAQAAARVVQLVLRSGRNADEAVKALGALNEAVSKGTPARRFVAGLESALKNMPKDASLERALKRLSESSGGNGEAN